MNPPKESSTKNTKSTNKTCFCSWFSCLSWTLFFAFGSDSCWDVLSQESPYAYAQPVNRLTGFPVLELVPFDEGQRNTFIARWYRAMQSYIGMSAANADYKAQSLQTAAQRPELVELASRPLLLTLMATLHTSRGTLPKDRAKLYDDSVELLLGSWQRRRLERGPEGQIVAEEAMMQVLDSDLGSIRTG